METNYDCSVLAQAVRALSSVCDGAFTEDGSGFNKPDSSFGHRMAKVPAESWNLVQANNAYRLLRKYRGQLSGFGIDYDAIAVPPAAPVEPVAAAPASKSRSTHRGERAQWTPRPQPPVTPPTLTFDNGVFTFAFDFRTPGFYAIVEAIKSIPGRRFDGVKKVWTVQLTLANAEAILEVARDRDFPITDEMEDACLAVVQVAGENITASRAEDADFTVAGLGGELRAFQRAGVQYASRAKRCLIGDDMGLGKTVQGLATVAHLNAYPALIVCPASVKINWKRETEKWLVGRSVEVLNGKPGAYTADVIIVNYDNLAKHVAALKGKLKAVVFDEFHYCKSRKAIRSQAAKELAAGVEIRLGLTGTPVLNRPAELINLLSILDRINDVGGFNKLLYGYAGGFNNGYGIEFPKNPDPAGLEELNTKLRATCMIRRTKSQVLTELPEKTRTNLWLKLDNQKAYDRAEREAADSDEPAAHLVRINTLRKLAAQGKLNAAKEWIADFLESGEKLVMFAHHIEIQDALAAEFPGCAVIRGEDDAVTRQANVDRFQNDPSCKLIVCSLKAAREGITLTAASNIAFLEQGWHPGEMQQAEDRVHRIGQRNAVNVWYLLAEETIDVEMKALIDQKGVVIKALAEGNRITEAELLSLQESAVSRIMATIKAKHRKTAS